MCSNTGEVNAIYFHETLQIGNPLYVQRKNEIVDHHYHRRCENEEEDELEDTNGTDTEKEVESPPMEDNSLLTFADMVLAINTTCNTDHTYAGQTLQNQENHNVNVQIESIDNHIAAMDTIQNEKDHTYAISGKLKSKRSTRDNLIPRKQRSLSEENLSRASIIKYEERNCMDTINSRKCLSEEKVFRNDNSFKDVPHLNLHNSSSTMPPFSSDNKIDGTDSLSRSLPVEDNMDFAKLMLEPPRKDHTYARLKSLKLDTAVIGEQSKDKPLVKNLGEKKKKETVHPVITNPDHTYHSHTQEKSLASLAKQVTLRKVGPEKNSLPLSAFYNDRRDHTYTSKDNLQQASTSSRQYSLNSSTAGTKPSNKKRNDHSYFSSS